MLIKVGYEFVFQVETPSLMLMMLALYPEREHAVRRHNGMIVEPYNVPRIGRVLMARGRDAADVAMTTSFGKNTLQRFRVWTDEVT